MLCKYGVQCNYLQNQRPFKNFWDLNFPPVYITLCFPCVIGVCWNMECWKEQHGVWNQQKNLGSDKVLQRGMRTLTLENDLIHASSCSYFKYALFLSLSLSPTGVCSTFVPMMTITGTGPLTLWVSRVFRETSRLWCSRYPGSSTLETGEAQPHTQYFIQWNLQTKDTLGLIVCPL